MNTTRFARIMIPLLLLAACAKGGDAPDPLAVLHKRIADTAARLEHTDAKVRVEHILISFAGTRTTATRTREQAEALAAQVLGQVDAGGDFSVLKSTNSDDPGEGIYWMWASGAPPPPARLRAGMVPAFGDVGWRLKVGEIGVAGFDPAKSPFGWHIIKRLE